MHAEGMREILDLEREDAEKLGKKASKKEEELDIATE